MAATVAAAAFGILGASTSVHAADAGSDPAACEEGVDERKARVTVVVDGDAAERTAVDEALAGATTFERTPSFHLHTDEEANEDGRDQRDGEDGEDSEDGEDGEGSESTRDWRDASLDEAGRIFGTGSDGPDGMLVVLFIGEQDRLDDLKSKTPPHVYVSGRPVPADEVTARNLEQAAQEALTAFVESDSAVHRQSRAVWSSQGTTLTVVQDATAPTTWTLDSPSRPVGDRYEVTDVLVDGRPVVCAGADGPHQLPVVLSGIAAGAQVSLDATPIGLDAVPLTGTLTPPTDAATDSTTGQDQPDAGDDGDDEEAAAGPTIASDSGGGLPGWAIPTLVVALVGAAAAAWLLLSRRRPATTASVPAEHHGPYTRPAAVAPLSAPAPDDAPTPAAPSPPPAPVPAGPGWVTNRAPVDTIGVDSSGVPIDPVPHGATRRTWDVPLDDGVAIAGWSEKVEDAGEDADPLVHAHTSGAAVIAVFDGTGGSGSAIVRREPSGAERTGAWVASRLAREVTCDWANTALAADPTTPIDDTLADRLRSWSHRIASQVTAGPAVRGSLHRVLPTTLAAIAVRPQGGKATVDALWAGDSRCFVLRPDLGLQTLSTDDTRETDALALIRDDQPMQNLVSADREFVVNHRRIRVALPAVVLVATDGCFGYVATPAHFEYHLLATLASAESAQDWMAQLTERLDGLAGDDTSIAVLCPGITSFQHLRKATAARLEHLRSEHWQPYQDASDEGEREAAREASWATYRHDFEALRGEGP